jgi:hypothetical protein
MGLEVGTLMMIGAGVSTAATVGSSVMGAAGASQSASRQMAQISQQQEEIRRQQVENRNAQSTAAISAALAKKSTAADEAAATSKRMREANKELGTLRAMDMGAAGKTRYGVELGYVTGVDLGQIGKAADLKRESINQDLGNRIRGLNAQNTSLEANISGLQSQKVEAKESADASWTSALFSSAVAIGGGALGAYTGYQQSAALLAEREASKAAAAHTDELFSMLGSGNLY